MSTSCFLPWIGSRYPAQLGAEPRLLLLGEAHYGDANCDYPDFTRYVVEQWGIRRPNRYFTVVAKLVLGLSAGEGLSKRARSQFFDSVAFYNYVPTLVGPRPGIRPREEQWISAEQPFKHVLNELTPQVVLVLGTELWGHLTGVSPYPQNERLRWAQLTDGSEVLFAMSRHPSAPGFRIRDWQPRVRELFKGAGYEDAFQGPGWRS